MIQAVARIAVWLLVIGLGYMLFGPELFDSSRSENPFASDAPLFLPPVKTQRLLEYEAILDERVLSEQEADEYRSLVRDRQSRFWQGDGVSVEDALADVKTERKGRLIEILIQRGMSQDELAIFFMVLERDHAALLADRG